MSLAVKREAQAPLLSSSSDEEISLCARPQDVSGCVGGTSIFSEKLVEPEWCESTEDDEDYGIDLTAADEDLNISDSIQDHDYRLSQAKNDDVISSSWTPSSPSESITSPISNTSRCSPPVKSPTSTCSSGSFDARQPGFSIHAHQARKSPARNKLSRPSWQSGGTEDDSQNILKYPQKYDINKLQLVEPRGCQTQRETSKPMTSQFFVQMRDNIFTPFSCKAKSKKLPATMRMRRLPKSYWEEPGSKTSTSEASSVPGISNHPLSTIHFSTYTILPPLFSSGGKTDFAAEEILGTRPVSPIEEIAKPAVSQSQGMTQSFGKAAHPSSGQKASGHITTMNNAELLASLFDSVTRDKPLNNQTSTSTQSGAVSSTFLGAKKHGATSMTSSTSGNGKKQLTRKQLDKPGRRMPPELKGKDPLLIEATITESLLPSLTIETAAHKSVVNSQTAITSNSIHL